MTSSGDAVATGEASIVIAASPERVWALVSDVTRMGEWSPENVGGRWLDRATGPAVGARFRGTNRRGKRSWSTTCQVLVADPGRELAFATGSAARPQTVWRYQMGPVPEGTRLRESFELVRGNGAISRLITRLTIGVLDRRADLEEGVRTTLARLREVAEAGATSRGTGPEPKRDGPGQRG